MIFTIHFGGFQVFPLFLVQHPGLAVTFGPLAALALKTPGGWKILNTNTVWVKRQIPGHGNGEFLSFPRGNAWEGSCLSSILGFEPSKRRPFPSKTRVIWVPGIYFPESFEWWRLPLSMSKLSGPPKNSCLVFLSILNGLGLPETFAYQKRFAS